MGSMYPPAEWIDERRTRDSSPRGPRSRSTHSLDPSPRGLRSRSTHSRDSSIRSPRRNARLRAALWCCLVVFLLVALVAGSALAHVKDWYEWCRDPAAGKPKRNLKVWVDPAAGGQWKQWTQEAMDNWNNANTGWTLTMTDQIEGADVTVHTAPIPARADGATVLGRCQSDFDSTTGEVIGVTITANSGINWGTSGENTVDPVKMLKHELGHTMRLTHSELGNIMEEAIGEGDHDRAPNNDDVDEAKQAASSTRPEPEKRVEGARTTSTLGPAALTAASVDFDAWAAHGMPLAVYPMEGIMLPDPLAVPEGLERVVVAAAVFPFEADFSMPADLRLTWEQGAISGLVMVGEVHGELLPPVDPKGMVPVRWLRDPAQPTGGTWVPLVAGVSLELAVRTGTFGLPGGGIYGLAAPAEGARPPVTGMYAFADVPSVANPLVAQALTELRTLDIYRGYPDGTAQPGRNLTRLEFFTIAVRLAGGEGAAAGVAGRRPEFADPIPVWAWGYVNQAVAMGLARGYDDGTFRPLNDVTGNEALTVLIRVLGRACVEVADAKPWPHGYVDAAQELGLMDDIADLVTGDLGAWRARFINRGEMAVLARGAAWIAVRYNGGGSLVPSPSIAAAGGWWRATVRVSALTADGGRWALRGAIKVPGHGAVDRLEVGESLYVAPGAGLPQAGQSVTVFGKGRTVHALLARGSP